MTQPRSRFIDVDGTIYLGQLQQVLDRRRASIRVVRRSLTLGAGGSTGLRALLDGLLAARFALLTPHVHRLDQHTLRRAQFGVGQNGRRPLELGDEPVRRVRPDALELARPRAEAEAIRRDRGGKWLLHRKAPADCRAGRSACEVGL